MYKLCNYNIFYRCHTQMLHPEGNFKKYAQNKKKKKSAFAWAEYRASCFAVHIKAAQSAERPEFFFFLMHIYIFFFQGIKWQSSGKMEKKPLYISHYRQFPDHVKRVCAVAVTPPPQTSRKIRFPPTERRSN